MTESWSADMWICATPIGNLSEISPRLTQTLNQVDFVLAEDTRVARKLLSHLDLGKEILRFDEHASDRLIETVIERLQAGESAALISDAGTPTISDPGQYLVRRLSDEGLRVSAVSGPAAFTVAFSISGILAKAFYFGAFLPRKKEELKSYLESLASLDAALIFYESPHRIAASLALIAELFPEREACLARELTKLHEECLRLPLPELARNVAERPSIKGEIVLIIGPPHAKKEASVEEIEAKLLSKMESGVSGKEASAEVARELGLPKNLVYDTMLGLKKVH